MEIEYNSICDKFLKVTDEILKQFQHDTGNRQVGQICDARLNSTSTDVEYLAKWKGFSDQEHSWCPVANILRTTQALFRISYLILQSSLFVDC